VLEPSSAAQIRIRTCTNTDIVYASTIFSHDRKPPLEHVVRGRRLRHGLVKSMLQQDFAVTRYGERSACLESVSLGERILSLIPRGNVLGRCTGRARGSCGA